MRSFTLRVVIVFVALVLGVGAAGSAAAAPEGTMTWGVHITLASRWLDPGGTEASPRRSWCSTPSTTRW